MGQLRVGETKAHGPNSAHHLLFLPFKYRLWLLSPYKGKVELLTESHTTYETPNISYVYRKSSPPFDKNISSL